MANPTTIRLLINGARGRMGARIVSLARQDPRFEVVAAIDRDDRGSAAALPPRSLDAVIDFSSDEGARDAAAVARAQAAALLVGTTGLSRDALESVEAASRSVPVIIAPNTSLGVAVLNHLAIVAARLLGSEFTLDLVEAHHAQKRDAPTGPAVRLIEALRRDAGVELSAEHVHCIRAGDIIGAHTLQFAGPGEVVTISHAATNRDLFARGALRAAAWLRGRPPGRYAIEQSLGIG
jgi:4-hydroxy-tetrahydrodipicolinate reductase